MVAAVKLLFIFWAGGIIYQLIEIFWAGHTHSSMFFAGGVCLLLINYIYFLLWNISPVLTFLACGAVITAVEFAAGYLVNIRLKLNVWDYSAYKFNFKGQICLLYSVLWVFLSIPAVFLCFAINNYIF